MDVFSLRTDWEDGPSVNFIVLSSELSYSSCIFRKDESVLSSLCSETVGCLRHELFLLVPYLNHKMLK
jgi:hypothetical protein